MIPDFKTYITESVWSDIRKRSTGEATRKEDDVNLLDVDGFAEYLNKLYEPTILKDCKIVGDSEVDGIIISLLQSKEGRYYNLTYTKISSDNPYVRFPVDEFSDIEQKLSNYYKVNRLQQYQNKIYEINPKDGSKITNSLVIDIIDFILNNTNDNLIALLKKKERS